MSVAGWLSLLKAPSCPGGTSNLDSQVYIQNKKNVNLPPPICILTVIILKGFSDVLPLCGSLVGQMQSDEQKQKVEKVRLARQKKMELTPELREKHSKHRETYHMTRQPLLDGLASEYDMELFKEAQARACELLVSEFCCLIGTVRTVCPCQGRVLVVQHYQCVYCPLFCHEEEVICTSSVSLTLCFARNNQHPSTMYMTLCFAKNNRLPVTVYMILFCQEPQETEHNQCVPDPVLPRTAGDPVLRACTWYALPAVTLRNTITVPMCTWPSVLPGTPGDPTLPMCTWPSVLPGTPGDPVLPMCTWPYVLPGTIGDPTRCVYMTLCFLGTTDDPTICFSRNTKWPSTTRRQTCRSTASRKWRLAVLRLLPGTPPLTLKSMHVYPKFTSVNSASSTWRLPPSCVDIWWDFSSNFGGMDWRLGIKYAGCSKANNSVVTVNLLVEIWLVFFLVGGGEIYFFTILNSRGGGGAEGGTVKEGKWVKNCD